MYIKSNWLKREWFASQALHQKYRFHTQRGKGLFYYIQPNPLMWTPKKQKNLPEENDTYTQNVENLWAWKS